MDGQDIKKGLVSVLPQSGAAYVLAVTDTAATFKIPDRLAGMIATVVLDGTDCDIVAGEAGVACVFGQASSVDGTSKEITPDAASGLHLNGGVPHKVQFPRAGYFSVACKTSGTGNLYITID